MTQEKYNTLHEFWNGAFLWSHPLYLCLCLSLSVVCSQHAEMRGRWRCYQWEASWNKEMWRFLTLTRTGPSVAMASVWWTLSFWASCYKMRTTIKWRAMTCASEHKRPSSKMYSSHCIQTRKRKPSGVLHLIIDLKCKSHRSSFVECCSLHPLSAILYPDSPASNEHPRTCCPWPALRVEARRVHDELQRVTVPQSM